MSEEQKIDDPPSHRILWTVCDITIFLYALIHVVLTFFIAWFTRSSSWALIFCFSSLIILIGLATVPCCCLSRTKADKLHRVLTSVLILASYIVIGICGSLLGWGAAGYSEYSSMKIAYDVTLDPSITDPAIFNISSKYSAFYFKGNNSFVFSMAGKYFLCGSCASYAGCCQWLHVVPVIMGNDPGGWVTKKLSVPLWISTISYEVDPFYAFGGSPFFGNSAVRNWNDQARFSDIYNALNDACNSGCPGNSIYSPVLMAGDVKSIEGYYNSFLIAGYVTIGFLVPLLFILNSFAFCLKL